MKDQLIEVTGNVVLIQQREPQSARRKTAPAIPGLTWQHLEVTMLAPEWSGPVTLLCVFSFCQTRMSLCGWASASMSRTRCRFWSLRATPGARVDCSACKTHSRRQRSGLSQMTP